MDMLEQAKERYAGANETGYEHGAQLAQAAALIAIAERLDKLIEMTFKVGSVTVRTEHDGKTLYVATNHLVDDDAVVRPANDED